MGQIEPPQKTTFKKPSLIRVKIFLTLLRFSYLSVKILRPRKFQGSAKTIEEEKYSE